MKAIRVDYDPESGTLAPIADIPVEDWVAVCETYHDDVHRIRNITDRNEFTGLYACFDDNDSRMFYLVEEDDNLKKLQRRHFFRTVGRSG
ncbi:MAG: hypothetical protein JEZ11_04125 [Desulfobacterales bacterium]|nr:hypothetical protein [Desulfobacterales bacterium]